VAASATANIRPSPVSIAERRQRIADIAVVRGIAGIVASGGGVVERVGVVVRVARVLAGVAQVGRQVALPGPAVLIVGEVGGVPVTCTYYLVNKSRGIL
jgi:hypothetical protein